MIKKSLLIFLLGLTILLSAVNEYQIEMENISPTEMDKITKIVSVDSYKNGQVVANAIDKELDKLDQLGFTYTVLPKIESNVKMSGDLREVRDWDTYPTYEAYVAMMNQFAADFPEICTIQTIGTSVEGREVLVAKISDNVNSEEAEPASFYSGTMHGDETAGYVILLRLIDYLTANYGSDDRITNLVNESEIWINPASNPDGTYAGGNDDINGAVRRNANGVDLNRNYPDFDDGEHPDGEATQQENIDMMAFALANPMVLSANFHGGTEVVNYPWDTIPERHADDTWWQLVSHEYADAAQEIAPNHYFNEYDDGITNGYDWYTVSGGRQDWFNYYAGTREFVLEISDVKLIPESALDNHWTWNKESLLLYLEQAMYGIRGTITDEAGNPIEATITVVDHDSRNSQVTSRADFGDFYRPIEAGTFELEISAYGYISQTIDDVTVSNGNSVVVDAALVLAGNTEISGTITDEADGTFVEGASIQLLNSPYAEVFSSAEGVFTMPTVFYNDYQIKIYKDGYSTQISEITVSAESNVFDFALSASTAESFENSFSEIWQFEGSADWFIDESTAYEGSASARSGSITDNQSSTLKLELNVSETSLISFYKKVSSEDSYDFLAFYIDDVELGHWDGNEDWSLEEYEVTPGLHTFSWTYTKDNSVGSGQDCGWIDLVTFPIVDNSSSPSSQVPALQVLGNYPNPFNPNTTISFSIAEADHVNLQVFNARGQLVRTLLNEMSLPGTIEVNWNGTDNRGSSVASGIYYYKIKTSKSNDTKKMILLK